MPERSKHEHSLRLNERCVGRWERDEHRISLCVLLRKVQHICYVHLSTMDTLNQAYKIHYVQKSNSLQCNFDMMMMMIRLIVGMYAVE